MAEHIHKFALLVSGPDCKHCHYESIIGLAMCECGEEIGPSTIERRLNAADQLSARTARKLFRIATSRQYYIEAEELKAYASALEGE